MPAYITDTRLCLDETKEKVVDCESPEARFLLAAEGSEVSAADAERYGLGPDAPPPAIPDEPPPGERFTAGSLKGRPAYTPVAKAAAPSQDKAARPSTDKAPAPAATVPEDDD